MQLGNDPATFARTDIGGTPPQVLDRIARLRELGAARVYLQTKHPRDLDQVELLGTEILPHVMSW